MRSFLFYLLILSLFPTFCTAQSLKADSLKTVIVNLPKDTTRLKALLELSTELYRLEPDSAVVYATRARDLAETFNRKEDMAYALKYIGLAYYFKSNFTEVLSYWRQSLEAFESIPDQLGISNLLSNLGAVYYSKGDNTKALEYYFESLRVAQELGDQNRIMTAYNNIGTVYMANPETMDQALETLTKSLKIAEGLDAQDAIGTTAINLGTILLQYKNQPDTALVYFNKALKVFEKGGGLFSTALNYTGSAYEKMGNYPLALKYLRQAYENAKSIDSKAEMAQSLRIQADVYYEQRKYTLAINAYDQSRKLAEEIGANLKLMDAYDGLAVTYAKLGEYENAYISKQKYVAIKDTIRSEEYDDKISSLRFQFDLENKEKEITLLNLDNEVKTAEIERSSLFRKYMYAVGGLLLSVIGGVSFQYWYARRSNKMLAEERNRSEKILLNILPKDTADELKEKGFVEAKKFDQVTVLFTDFKEFTKFAEGVPAEELVKSVDFYFKKFDEITTKYNLEKIKTIGDAYMCAGGLPVPNKTNPIDATNAAIEIVEFMNEQLANPTPGIHSFEVRVGLHTGPVVAGVVGIKKFQYDIWGDTVNIAARMESGSVPGKINVSEATYRYIRDQFSCTYRGEMEVKHSGRYKMYFVDSVMGQEHADVEVASSGS